VPRLHIADRAIGPGSAVFLIAEMSANHGADRARAAAIVRAAKAAGADAIKIQTYTADTLTIDAPTEWFRIPSGPWGGQTLHALYRSAFTPWEWHQEIRDVAREEGLVFFSTPFDRTAVEFLERLNVPAYKIASFELVDTGLLKAVAATGKPVMLSTGMASLGEIAEAVDTLRRGGSREIALLKCTSAYPAPPDSMNLRTIPDLAARFDTVVGLSDHTLGPESALGATALGASIIEKHFVLARADGGPDAAFSLEPHEFAAMASAIRTLEAALGAPVYGPSAEEQANLLFRRSLFVVEDVHRGDVFTARNVRSIRPAHGLPPRELDTVIGRTATRDVTRGTPLARDMVEGAFGHD
jgi:N-acetylneuraminate synthase